MASSWLHCYQNSMVSNLVCLLVYFSGFINATVAVHNSLPVGAMMYVSAVLFLIGVIVDIVLLLKVCLHIIIFFVLKRTSFHNSA